ncbi:MAG: acetate--CoA ligase family protein [Actinobacteria bacterium]|nr:acetate--CoA ligase family protein [Actinomycetota bacterium]
MSNSTLADYGFVLPRAGLAGSEEEAVSLALGIGFPVALKVESPEILHKTDIGGVELGLGDADAVTAAFRRIMRAATEKAPQARVHGVWVEEMITGGFEIIIGLKRDAQFGPVIMFGLGGIFTEVLEDVSFRVLPITSGDAAQMIEETRGARILRGYRGQSPVQTEMLVDLLMSAARFGLELGDDLESADFNPIVVWDRQHRVLDFKLVRGKAAGVVPRQADAAPAATGQPPGGAPPVMPTEPQRVFRPVNTAHLDTFFAAESVAVVGASASPGKIGYAVLESLANSDYLGKVFPVNPGRDAILGLPAFATLTDIPEPVELVVCTVDLAMVPGLMRECAAKDVHNLVVVSGGGKELGGERAAIEAEVRQLSGELDVRVIGPNCIGVFDGKTRLDTFFQPRSRMTRPPTGKVAMMSQSGTTGIAFLEAMAPCGMSKFVSYGNRADVDEADLLSYLAGDPETAVIALYVEGFENGRGFLEAAKSAAAHKPVVIFKSGRTPSAAKAALTHTGFLAGSYKVVEGAFRQAGVIAVDTYEELVAVSKALAMQPQAAGPRVAMVGNGIGTTVQALDVLTANGLQLAELASITLENLDGQYPSFYIVANPLDITGSGSSMDYEVGIQALLDDPSVDIVMPWLVFQDAPLNEDIPEKLGRLYRSAKKPILCGATGGTFTQRMAAAIEAQGVPVFNRVCDWVAAARGLAFRSGWPSARGLGPRL